MLKTKEEIEAFFKDTPPEKRNQIGKQYYRYMDVTDIDKAHPLEVPDAVIDEYEHDKNRRGMNLTDPNNLVGTKPPESVAGLPPFDHIIPCFFLKDGGTVTSLGHGQSYRVPYDNATVDAIPEALREATIDFSDAIFGKVTPLLSWASRVAFDDGIPRKLCGAYGADKAHPLMQPNPTAFQLYLEQDDRQELVHWDAAKGPKIRGYKMYWHQRNGHEWRATKAELANEDLREAGAADIAKRIAPLKAGAVFDAAIRFRDLSTAELGALLKVFSLGDGQEDIAYKLGMGKSIGLGSIRIKPELRLETRDAWGTLFDEDGWHDAETSAAPAPFIKAFEDYLETYDDGALEASYRRTLAALHVMMDFRHTKTPGWEAETRPMPAPNNKEGTGPSFAARNILPTPQEVVAASVKK